MSTRDGERAPTDPRRTWTIGGALLLASAVLGPASEAAPGLFPATWFIGSGLYAATLLVYAWGRGSVTARRPLGSIALTVLAATTLALPVLLGWGPPSDSGEAFGAGFAAAFFRGILVQVLLLAAAIVAVVQIGRAGVVPRPWNWAPLWALASVVLTGVLVQGLIALLIRDLPGVGSAAGAAVGIVQVAAPAFLGAVSLVLAGRWRPAPAPAG